MASTLDDVFRQRWNLLVPELAYNADFGIPTFWRQHPELGSPLGPEVDLGNGVTAQAFSGGVCRWTPGMGAEIVSEWVGSSIPAHYLSVEQLAQAALDLVPAGKWDGVELLLKAGEGGSWIARVLHPTWGDPSHLALNGPTTLASHIEVAKALGVR